MNIIILAEDELFLPAADERAKHIRKVLHLAEGDSFRAGIENGKRGTAFIKRMDERGIELFFAESDDGSELYPLTLIVAQVRPICMRRILRETVSLGVRKLVLPVSDLGEKSYLGASLYTEGEYRKILLDGAMQSGFTGVSAVSIVSSLDEAIAEAEGDEKILLDNRAGAIPLSGADLSGKSVVLAIGPERGWSAREVELFEASGYSPMLIGKRILRTETAAVGGTLLALSRMGFV